MFDEAEVNAREVAALQAADAAERAYREELAQAAYDFSYSYRVQYRLQIVLSCLFSASCATFLVWVSDCRSDGAAGNDDDEQDDGEAGDCGGDERVAGGLVPMAREVLRGDHDGWDTTLYGLSLGGVLMVAVAVAAVVAHRRAVLRFYLAYIFATLLFSVLYHVLQLDQKLSAWGYSMLGLAGVLVLLISGQLYYAMYFLRILDFYDVYFAHPRGAAQRVPVDDLVALMAQLRQAPKQSQIAELLTLLDHGGAQTTAGATTTAQLLLDDGTKSLVGDGAAAAAVESLASSEEAAAAGGGGGGGNAPHFTFEQFCQVEGRMYAMENEERKQGRREWRRRRMLTFSSRMKRRGRGGRNGGGGVGDQEGDDDGGEAGLLDRSMRLDSSDGQPPPIFSNSSTSSSLCPSSSLPPPRSPSSSSSNGRDPLSEAQAKAANAGGSRGSDLVPRRSSNRLSAQGRLGVLNQSLLAHPDDEEGGRVSDGDGRDGHDGAGSGEAALGNIQAGVLASSSSSSSSSSYPSSYPPFGGVDRGGRGAYVAPSHVVASAKEGGDVLGGRGKDDYRLVSGYLSEASATAFAASASSSSSSSSSSPSSSAAVAAVGAEGGADGASGRGGWASAEAAASRGGTGGAKAAVAAPQAALALPNGVSTAVSAALPTLALGSLQSPYQEATPPHPTPSPSQRLAAHASAVVWEATFEVARPLGMRVAADCAVERIEPDGQAAALGCGIRVGNFAIGVDGEGVASLPEIQSAIARCRREGQRHVVLAFSRDSWQDYDRAMVALRR